MLFRKQHLHTIVKQGVRLRVVQDVKPSCESFLRLHFEEEPLDVALRVGVVLEDEVVLGGWGENCCCEVTRLKCAVEV